METYEQFTDEQTAKILSEIEANLKKPSLEIGDIVDLDWGHTKKGARIFAKVTKLFKHGGIAFVDSIICHREPYLCDHVFDTMIDSFDLSKKADMELFENKMKPTISEVSENDPYAEETWGDDGEDYVDFEEWELKREQFNIDDPYDEEKWEEEDEGTEYGDYETSASVIILNDIDVEIVYSQYNVFLEKDEETFRDTLHLKKVIN